MDNPWPLVVDASILLVSAGCYAAVARIVAKRGVDAPYAFAQRGFVAWWGGIAAAMAALAVVFLLPVLGVEAGPLYGALFELFIVANALAVAGVGAHLLSIYVEGRWVQTTMYGLLVGYFLLYTALLFEYAPDAVRVQEGLLVLEGLPTSTGTLSLVLVACFYAPHLLASFAYAALLVKAETAAVRYRITLMAGSLLLSTLSFLFLIAEHEMGRADMATLALAASLVGPVSVLLAFAPPAWVQRRLEVVPLRAGLDP